MSLMSQPTRFDVLLTENTFGDILSDEASVLWRFPGHAAPAPASARAHPSSSRSTAPRRPWPAATWPIPSGRWPRSPCCLRHALHLEAEAQAVETAIERTLADGWGHPRTSPACPRACGTRQLGDQICGRIKAPARVPA